jgi:endonuclease/exonuclease/phosphatase family metal-dependent hydrolase
MRLISYNILDGGAGRVDLLARVIAGQNADIVALVEADDPAVVEQLAGRLSMDFIHVPGNKKASALLSRWPICETINHAPMHKSLTKSLLEATVISPAGAEWILGVAHLHARATEEDESIREQEIATVLQIFEPHRRANQPHLLAGDFNSNAPYQQIDPSRCKPSTRRAFIENGGYIPRRGIQRLLDAGYSDSLRASQPLLAETAVTFTPEFPGQRVDYIFTFNIDPQRIRSARVVYDDPARDASDHYPVWVEIDRSGKTLK